MTDEDLEILAEEITDFASAMESAAVHLKMQISKVFGDIVVKEEILQGLEVLKEDLKLRWKEGAPKEE